MLGVLFSIVAGVLVALQGVFNTRVSDKVGLWETTAIVHGVGLIFSLSLLLVLGKGSLHLSLSKINEVNKLYLVGGVFGVIIVFSVMRGITLLGPALAVAVLLIVQLLVSTLIDNFGWFGVAPIRLDWTKFVGIVVMILGIVIFKSKG